MIVSKRDLKSKDQTASEMKRLISRYASDLEYIYLENDANNVPLSELSLNDYFDFVKNIPYKKDTRPIEVIGRPKVLLTEMNQGLDCKKKAVLISAYLKLHGIPYKLVASSCKKNKKLHHIFPQGKIEGEWINLDATYPQYKIGQKKEVTAYEFV